MPDSAVWILKIISGPHQGAEVALHPGRVVVGAHAECDLVLHDVLVAPQHFALTFNQDNITVEPLEGRVFCNGKRVIAATSVPEFGFLTAGTTHLVLGPSSARWPLLSLADVPELEKEPGPAAITTADTANAAASAASNTDSSVDPKSAKAPTLAQRRRALWTAGIGAALLIVWLALWLAWTPHTTHAPRSSVRERAEQVLGAFPTAKTIQLEQQGERLVASGYVDSESAHREITSAFRNELPEVTLRIWSTPRMLETARSFLTARNLTLEVSAGDAGGELRVRGTMRSRDDWTRVRQLLLAEVPGLQTIREEIAFPPVASAANRAPVVSAPAAPSAPATTAVPAEAVSVVALQELGDGQGWLRLSNGTVLFRGGTLDGGRVTSIRQGRAFVEKDDARFVLTVGADVAAALRAPLARENGAETKLPDAPPVAAQKTTPPNG